MSKTSRFVDFRAVKAAVTMEQVLEHYGWSNRFTRGKDSLSGPCPIHQGTNATQFRVSVSKNCWHCFGDCQAGGNVLDFVARMEAVEPIEAANRMIQWFGLAGVHGPTSHTRTIREQASKPAPQNQSPAQPPTPVAAPATYPASAESSVPNRPLGFVLDLDVHHPYLTERGLSKETIAEFGIGYCRRGVMADRIAIPIHNVSGELVAYAGRWPGDPPDGRPKYRLPDGFKKSQELYRLAKALQEPTEQPLIIVEGFFDVMNLWQLGLRKCVAVMGSSLSDEQERLIASAVSSRSTVLIMFDEDDAGRAGRDDVLCRLARKAFVRVVTLGTDNARPATLTAEEVQLLNLV